MNWTWKRIKAVAAVGLLLAAGLGSGCVTSGEGAGGGGTGGAGIPAPVAAPLDAGGGARVDTNIFGIDLLRVGDKLTIALTDIPTPYTGLEQRVREDGTITLPLGVSVIAAGKKAGDLEREIQKEYVPKFFVRLTVTVKPEERVFYVGGYVRAPGRYVFAGEMSVLGAIKVAGDITEYGNRRKVELTRADKSKKEIIDCKKAQKTPTLDLPIYPNDSIYVPQRVW